MPSASYPEIGNKTFADWLRLTQSFTASRAFAWSDSNLVDGRADTDTGRRASSQRGSDSNLILVPLLDLINHQQSTKTNCRFFFDVRTKTMSGVALVDLEPGQELFHSYGVRSSAELLTGYGFVILDSHDDRTILSYELAADALSRLAAATRARIASNNTSPSNTPSPNNTSPNNTTPSNTTPSNNTSSNNTSSNTTPSNTTPSNTTPSNTTPSISTPSPSTGPVQASSAGATLSTDKDSRQEHGPSDEAKGTDKDDDEDKSNDKDGYITEEELQTDIRIKRAAIGMMPMSSVSIVHAQGMSNYSLAAIRIAVLRPALLSSYNIALILSGKFRSLHSDIYMLEYLMTMCRTEVPLKMGKANQTRNATKAQKDNRKHSVTGEDHSDLRDQCISGADGSCNSGAYRSPAFSDADVIETRIEAAQPAQTSSRPAEGWSILTAEEERKTMDLIAQYHQEEGNVLMRFCTRVAARLRNDRLKLQKKLKD